MLATVWQALAQHARALWAFVRAYAFWIVALGVVNLGVWIAAESVYLADLRCDPSGLWSVRMYLASGLLLFDNLCVLWWYADSAKRQAAATEGQLTIIR